MMFTILSEFPGYSEQEVMQFNTVKLNVVFKEALRQRASKYRLLGKVINMPNYEKGDQKKIQTELDHLVKPHIIIKAEVSKKQVKDTWALFRAKRRIR